MPSGLGRLVEQPRSRWAGRPCSWHARTTHDRHECSMASVTLAGSACAVFFSVKARHLQRKASMASSSPAATGKLD